MKISIKQRKIVLSKYDLKTLKTKRRNLLGLTVQPYNPKRRLESATAKTGKYIRSSEMSQKFDSQHLIHSTMHIVISNL